MKPSVVPIHSLRTGTSCCVTSATITTGGGGGGAASFREHATAAMQAVTTPTASRPPAHRTENRDGRSPRDVTRRPLAFDRPGVTLRVPGPTVVDTCLAGRCNAADARSVAALPCRGVVRPPALRGGALHRLSRVP